MSDKTEREMIAELHQVVIGIPNNPVDNGLVGDIAEIRKQVTLTNGTVNLNVSRIITLEKRAERIEHTLDKARSAAVEASLKADELSLKVEELRGMARTIQFTRNQTIGGGVGVFTFLSLLIVAVGKILGWW